MVDLKGVIRELQQQQRARIDAARRAFSCRFLVDE
jgi:hypothetical protein